MGLRLVLLFVGFLAALAWANASDSPESSHVSPDPQFSLGRVLAADDFDHDTADWKSELEKGGRVRAENHRLDIDVPGGCTVWWAHAFSGPILIDYIIMPVREQGPNDRVSDVNCFWMATDGRDPNDIFAVSRSGRFSDYDALRCYYVGYGGNSNSTTRFRRYVGEKGNRPLRPEHDLMAPRFLLQPNRPLHLQLIAAGSRIRCYRDGECILAYDDPAPYVRGWFGFRTVASHLRVEHFRVYRLESSPTPAVK